MASTPQQQAADDQQADVDVAERVADQDARIGGAMIAASWKEPELSAL